MRVRHCADLRFNEAIAYNKSLREQIDGLRRERVVSAVSVPISALLRDVIICRLQYFIYLEFD